MVENQDFNIDKSKKMGFIKQMIMTNQLNRLIVYMSAIIPMIVLFFLSALAFLGVLKPLTLGNIIIGTYIDYIAIGVIVGTGVYGFYEFSRMRRIRLIDNRFPDFVRDIAESRRAGMTFTKAIMNASKGNYGVLTSEIEKIARQISWGSSVETALESFAKRVNTKLIHRIISLIIEASHSGGNVADVLDAASKDAREIKLIESERKAGMLSYVAIVYVGLGVFLLIIIILCKSFLPAVLGYSSAEVASSSGDTATIVQGDISLIYYLAALIQSGGMGIVTGVFEEGDMISGIKHSFIMMLITWIMFKFVVTGI
jgi:flagellar protein FlaJ